MLRKVLVLLNAAAGTLAASRRDEESRIGAMFQSRGIAADVRSCDADALREIARGAMSSDVDAIIAAGGDGTLNTVANAIAGGPKPFGVLPLGTHNHFAKDLGMPLDLDAAIAALASGIERDLSVGEVNGTIFLNFSALGLHPIVVKHRDAQSKALGRNKWLAFFVALWRALRRPPLLSLRIDADGKVLRRVATSVIVCNNEHQMRVFGVERAATSDRDLLNVFVAGRAGAMGILSLIARALVGRLDRAKNFEAMHVSGFDIALRREIVRVSIDGEVTELHPPLKYRVRHAGLRVIVPGTGNNSSDATEI